MKNYRIENEYSLEEVMNYDGIMAWNVVAKNEKASCFYKMPIGKKSVFTLTNITEKELMMGDPFTADRKRVLFDLISETLYKMLKEQSIEKGKKGVISLGNPKIVDDSFGPLVHNKLKTTTSMFCHLLPMSSSGLEDRNQVKGLIKFEDLSGVFSLDSTYHTDPTPMLMKAHSIIINDYGSRKRMICSENLGVPTIGIGYLAGYKVKPIKNIEYFNESGFDYCPLNSELGVNFASDIVVEAIKNIS
jgi:hypothetical protein